jgi:shikimate kinase
VAVEIARALEVDVMDLDDAIELQEMMSISKIREQYGDSRLKKLEHDLCRKAALMRRSVIVVPGAALLDSRNYPLLSERGIIAVITCELGEALRRLHQGSALHFRDRTLRGRMIGRIRREYKIISDPAFLQLDTTHLSITEQRDILINLWLTGKPNHPLVRTGPGPQIKPPPRNPVGLTNLTQAEQRKKPGRRFQDEQLS